MESFKEILMRRDRMGESEAEDVIEDLRQRVMAGEDPEELLHDELGLEPDYIWEILP